MAVSLTSAKNRVETDLPDSTLQTIIDAETEAVERRHGSSSVVETQNAKGIKQLILRRKPASVTSITERRNFLDDAVTLSANDWRQIGDRVLLRLPDGDNPENDWGEEVVITYTAVVDDNLRDRVILDLVQLSVEFRAFESEKSGDWQGDQGDYKTRREALLNQIREPGLLVI